MKNLIIFGYVVLIALTSCKPSKDISNYYISISPIGNADAPLPILYISIKAITKITNIDFNENAGFIDTLRTDEKTLRNIIDFINSYNYSKKPSKKNIDFGYHDISVWNKNSIVKKYVFDLSDSRDFLYALNDFLINRKLDRKVIKELRETVLNPIDY